MSYRFLSVIDSIKTLNTPIKHSIAFILVFVSCHLHAAPPDMGSITVTSSDSSGNASGSYIAAGSGATGSFTLTRNATTGYNNTVDILGGINGIEITNNANSAIHNDSFTYTFTITPDNNNAIHSIKIGQASYTKGGNSEVARHTLSNVTQNSAIDIPSRLYVKDNPSVPFYYEAMGDYFMGRRESSTNVFSYEVATSEAQVRSNSSNNLYFFKINELAGTNLGGNNRRQLSTIGNEVRFANSSSRGVLPDSPTFANILKSTSSNQNTFKALSNNQTINGNSYVTYGIENDRSNYVVAVRNVTSITLTYDAIMNGSNAFSGNVIGETFNEWISFGVESEPLYVFSGKVFNDNGGIENANPQDTSIVSNTNYFNGKLDNNESGISAPNLQIRLTDCNNNNIVTVPGTPNPQTVANTNQDRGKYSFSVLPTILANNTTGICVVEEEPQTSSWSYTVDTTPNKLNSNFPTDNYNYTDLNFGEVTQNNSALALKKYQFVHKCDTTLQYESIEPDTSSPLTGFSTEDIGSIDPGMCIAYKIEAHNRGHLALTDIQIMDSLQKKSSDQSRVESVFQLPESEGIHAGLYKDNNINSGQANIGENGTIISENFALTNTTSSTSSSMKELYFNTKYGTTTTP